MPVTDPARRKVISARYYQRNKDTIKARNRAWMAAHPEKQIQYDRKAHLVRRLPKLYGISYDEYLEMNREQDELCAVCGMPEQAVGRDGVRRSLSVDHDHETGVVRALLCMKCNLALGSMRDDPDILESGAAYLRSHRGVRAVG